MIVRHGGLHHLSSVVCRVQHRRSLLPEDFLQSFLSEPEGRNSLPGWNGSWAPEPNSPDSPVARKKTSASHSPPTTASARSRFQSREYYWWLLSLAIIRSRRREQRSRSPKIQGKFAIGTTIALDWHEPVHGVCDCVLRLLRRGLSGCERTRLETCRATSARVSFVMRCLSQKWLFLRLKSGSISICAE
ncbi:uncharacterized protein BJX67DRAFT_138560 [Aspergillus lucknowensis]|uniref:Uncharacterized protein n=1 Tax=Aspergillus lucknowensis TaxID=176173 RepID=A0ABR4LPD7_9EURO